MRKVIFFICIWILMTDISFTQDNSAIVKLEKSLESKINLLGERHPEVTKYQDSLGLLYLDVAKYDMAQSLFDKALEIKSKTNNDLDLAQSYDNLGILSLATKNYKKADSLFNKAMAIKTEHLGPDHSNIFISYRNLAEVYLKKGNTDKALSYCNKAIEHFDDKHFALAETYNVLGLVYIEMGDYKKALTCHKKALQIGQAIYGCRQIFCLTR